jgi:cytochrome b561
MSVDHQRYTSVAIALHWATAILMIYMLFLGEDLIKVGRGASLAGVGPSLHASIGMSVFVLSVARLFWRLANPPPPLPVTMKTWEKALSHSTHVVFYGLLVLLPLTGWFALAHYGTEHRDIASVLFFGFFPAAIWPDIGWNFGGLHEILSKLGILLLALHVLAALKHQFYDKDNIFARMSLRR